MGKLLVVAMATVCFLDVETWDETRGLISVMVVAQCLMKIYGQGAAIRSNPIRMHRIFCARTVLGTV